MDYNKELYKNLILLTKRGNNCGIVSNAKPIFVLTIIDAISEGIIIGNRIMFDNSSFKELYKANYIKYENEGKSLFSNNVKITPYNMPYFHLNAESYYHIKWNGKVVPPKQAQSPSNKFLVENVEYSYIDDELWEMLQSSEMRTEFKNAILNHFFTK